MLPILFQSHNFIVYSYPLLMGVGWGVGYQLFLSRATISHRSALILFWSLFLSSWVGAKLFFLLTAPDVSSGELSVSVSFWIGGGFVFYGGLIGAAAIYFIYRKLRLPMDQQTLAALVSALAMGHAIGRIGCFLAGCCFGEVTDAWWGIHQHGEFRHPTQLLESLGLFFISWLVWSKKATSLSLYLVTYGILRFGIEFLRGDIIRGSWGFLTPSQWISLFAVLVGLAFLNKPKISAT
jgi:phosphatidylglycerol:prolipoprotein diacylglycerol transferase